MTKPEVKLLVKKGLPWLKRLQGALDDDDSSDSSQPAQTTPSKVKKKRPEKEEKDGRRRVKKKRLRRREDNDSDDVALEDSDSAKEKRRRRLKKPEKTRRKRLVDEDSKTPPRESVDTVKAKAAASREQRMHKLHANRVSTGEFDKMAAFKLKRKVSSEALKEKKRNRIRAVQAAQEVQDVSAEADGEDKGGSRPRPANIKDKADTSVKRKLGKIAALEKVDTTTEQEDSPTFAHCGGGQSEEESHAVIKAEPVEGDKHDDDKDGKVEGSMTSPEPIKLEDSKSDLSSSTRNLSNELDKRNGNGGVCVEDIKVEFSEPETVESAVKAEVNACEGLKNECTTQKEPEVSDATDIVPVSGILVDSSNYEPKEQEKIESFVISENVGEKEDGEEGQVEISGVIESVKTEDSEEKKVSEEKKELLLEMMPIPRKAPNGGKPTAPPSQSAESFVIPKRTFAKTDLTGPETADQNERAVTTEFNASVGKRSLDAPAPVTMLPSPSPESSPKLPRQEQRKRTKNPVPVKNALFSSQDKALMRLSRKRNSIYMAAIELSDRVPDCRSSRKKSTTQMMGYEVYDVDGETMPDLIPRLSCATKREMSSNQESYTASFFGVSLCAPVAKGKSRISIDKRGDHDRDTRNISCYEELRFERPEDREFYQQKMYGTAFVPQKLRGRITLVVRNARFERKSTGIRFNQDRDREEFAASLSKRYTFKKSIPRCDIPRENWQKLMRNQAGTVYLHYYNREDAERASHIFRDDDGQPLVLRLELKAGAKIMGSFAAIRSSPQHTPSRSYSSERSVPESSPLLSQNDSAHNTPSWRRERPPASSGDSRYSKYDRSAPHPPAPWSRGEDRYGSSLSGNKRSRALLERRARSRSRSKSFHSNHYGFSYQESRAGSEAAERSNTRQYASDGHFRSDGGNENPSSAVHSDVDGPEPKRARTLSRSPYQSPAHYQDRSERVEKNGGNVREQEDGKSNNNSEMAPISPVGFSDGGDNRRERDRSPSGRWQQRSHSSQTHRRRDSFSDNFRDRSRMYVPPQRSTLQTNRGLDQQGSMPRSRPSNSSPSRGGRGGDRFKDRRGSRDFGRGNAYTNNTRERHMHSDRSRGGYSEGRNSRPR